jgi:uncharacterized membrane protein (DUF2068 family)
MRRSTGVTVSAIFVFLGSGVTLLFGALMAFALLLAPKTPAQPPFVRYALAFSIVMTAAFAIWGVASGVGLLYLKQWARISMIVFCCIMLLFTVPGMILMPFLPMPQTPGSPDNLAVIFKIGMSAFYGVFVLIGGAWLYFFNQKNVKEQFSPVNALIDPTAPQAVQRPKRPLSISIIGWILVITSFFALPTLFLRSPMLFLGFLLTGWAATFFMLAWCVVQAAAGVGLLRLRSWGRTLAICVFSFGLLNMTAMFALPGAAARFQQANAAAQANMQARMGLPVSGTPTPYTPEFMLSFTRIILIVAGVFLVVQLWFVVTRKNAFSPANEVASLSP